MSNTGKPWRPAEVPLMTPWGEQVDPENVWPEYPRPQMARSRWMNLNGLWSYAVAARTAACPKDYEGRILVPFCIESALSGVGRRVQPDERLWYQRTFEVPSEWKPDALLLHFGAVDFEATVWVNGGLVGTHRGGNTPFFFDISDFLVDGKKQELVISVWDPTNTGDQPRGKQDLTPHGIWYTPVTGIWQTVWLEPVPRENSIEELRITPCLDTGRVCLEVAGRIPTTVRRDRVRLMASFQGTEVARAEGLVDDTLEFVVTDPQVWGPDHPHLYDLKVELLHGGGAASEPMDQVTAYFAMRKIALKNRDGAIFMELNNKPLFQYGVLDQGWWPDGLLTPPSVEALLYDVDFLKQAGFNTIRKHIKVEPQAFYAHCDRIGMLVWQDMPSGFAVDSSLPRDQRCTVQHIPRGGPKDVVMRSQSAIHFDAELREMIAALYNYPCIIAWVPLNEGWGQHESHGKTQLIREVDATRLISSNSGWEDRGCGDMYDIHNYQPETELPEPDGKRAAVLGEFGGLGYAVKGHLWWDRNWGYQSYEDVAELVRQYQARLNRVLLGIKEKQLQAAIYTQTTDVEGEINGLITYDRRVVKIPADQLAAIHRPLYEAMPGA